ncbi:MAG: PQQ-binding-like beta-propeller repeat protein, partial [Pirellulaceae bacterium]|nr:PQQ-binding-like beta-propeller repeat protein [Pirellulaceae bacterium]
MKGSYLLTLMLVSLVAGCQPAARKPATISSTKKPTKPPAAASQTRASGKVEKKTDEETRPGSDANPSEDNSAPAKPDPPADSQVSQPTDTAPANLGTRQQGTDWATFLGPGANNKSTETGVLKQWPEKGLRIVWQKELGTSYGIGSVANGRYYQFDRTDETIHLDCLNAETGKPLWKFKYPSDYEDLYGYDGGPRASPLVDGNRVYLFGVEGLLHCLNAETGKLIWKFDTVKNFGVVQNFFGAGSTPVIEGDLLIAMVGGSPAESQTLAPGDLSRVTGNGTGIVAFNKNTGKVRYKISDELASYASPVLTTIDNRRWCFAFARSGLLGFDPLLGKIDFHYPWRARSLESVNASTPVIVKNEVFISETYGPG